MLLDAAHPPWPFSPALPLSASPGSPSGTSLLQEVVYLVSQGADPDEIGLMNIDEQLPVLEYPQPGLDIIKVTAPPEGSERGEEGPVGGGRAESCRHPRSQETGLNP